MVLYCRRVASGICSFHHSLPLQNVVDKSAKFLVIIIGTGVVFCGGCDTEVQELGILKDTKGQELRLGMTRNE